MTEYKNYPLFEVMYAADELIYDGATVFQKWTCRHCQSRQTMSVANTFFRSGKCEACGNLSVISECNYMVVTGRLPDTGRG